MLDSGTANANEQQRNSALTNGSADSDSAPGQVGTAVSVNGATVNSVSL